VADARGFTAAGDLIGLTQSGISQRRRHPAIVQSG
jgi:DNA-binding transcriptional LysR family regulator